MAVYLYQKQYLWLHFELNPVNLVSIAVCTLYGMGVSLKKSAHYALYYNYNTGINRLKVVAALFSFFHEFVIRKYFIWRQHLIFCILLMDHPVYVSIFNYKLSEIQIFTAFIWVRCAPLLPIFHQIYCIFTLRSKQFLLWSAAIW